MAPAGGKIYTLAGCHWLDAIPAPTEAHHQVLIESVRGHLRGTAVEGPTDVPALPPGAIAPVSGPTLRTRLPADVSRLIGREREAAELEALLEDEATRLVTLTGPGGVGKTRLALQVARQWTEAHSLPACFVEMESITGPEEAAPAVLEALGVPQSPGADPVRQLGEVLGRQPLLLVCDNTEQIVELGGLLRRWLKEAPGLACLITSRATLGLPEEVVYRLAPLPLPGHGASPEELARCESVALFSDRARAVAPDWALDSHNAGAVAEICRRLEGMPLCLELAASRMAVLSAEEALEGLDDVLGFLAARSPNLPSRQRTLRGAIEWSRRLLPETDQVALAQLSVLRGGFFGEAAAAVTGSGYLLDLLQDLQEHSLLVARRVGGKTRYAMLETVRAYAAETLAPPTVADPQAIHRLHAEHFGRVAGRLARCVRGPDEALALAEAGLEHDNLRAALDWAEARDLTLCAHLAPLAADLMVRRGLWAEALHIAERGLAAARGANAPELLAAALGAWASARHDRGDLAAARQAAEEALAIRRQSGDGPQIARAANLLALIAQDEGDPARAEELLAEALVLWRAAGDAGGQAIALNNLGRLSLLQRRPDEARTALEEARALRERVGDRRGLAETLGNLGVLAQESGDLPAARDHYRACLVALRGLGDEAGCATQLYNLGEVAGLAGAFEVAIPLVAGAVRIFRHLDSPAAQDAELLLLRFSDQPGAQPFGERLRAADALPTEDIMRMAEAQTTT